MFFKNAVILISFILTTTTIFTLSIPFYSIKNLHNSTTHLEILDFFKNNNIYSFIEIGEPPQNLPIIITSHDSSSIIKKTDCPISSNYDINFSKNVQIIYEENNNRYYFIKEYISFDKYNNNKLYMNFIYYNHTDIIGNTCGFIGTQFIQKNEVNDTNNLIIELKKMNIINKTIFYFNYTEDDNGFLNIGIEPFEINPLLYSKKNMKIINTDSILDFEIKKTDRYQFRWNLNFSKVFYFKKLPIQSKLDPYVEVSRKKTRKVNYFQALLVPEQNLIKGPFEYQELIDDDFFDSLISNSVCKKVNFERKFFYVCKKDYKDLIKKTFPSLYFYSNALNNMFVLNYDDLFIEKGEYLIFSIYFDFLQIEVFAGAFLSEWHFGKTFLKKYCFSFDPDKGQIRFYKDNIIKPKKTKKPEEKNVENTTTQRLYQLGLILIVVAIGALAFALERIVKRKNRINNSLIDYENQSINKT